jgi:hypothetical protein
MMKPVSGYVAGTYRKHGVKGNRAQFVAAVTRPVEHDAFLSQLAH